MIRTALAAAVALALGLPAARAEEVKGTVKKADPTAKAITLTVDGKDKRFDVSKDASFVSVATVPGKKNKTTEKVTTIENGLAGIKAGSTVTVLTDTQDGKDVVTSVKVSAGTVQAKKKKKNQAGKALKKNRAGNALKKKFKKAL